MTLACLEAIEETNLERLSLRVRLPQDPQGDLGILVPLVLIELVGADGLETYRHSESLKNSTRSCPLSFAQRSWVSRYTPHRLTIRRMRLSDRRLKRPSWSRREPNQSLGQPSQSQCRFIFFKRPMLGSERWLPVFNDWNLNAFGERFSPGIRLHGTPSTPEIHAVLQNATLRYSQAWEDYKLLLDGLDLELADHVFVPL